jgi:hypothetical protein
MHPGRTRRACLRLIALLLALPVCALPVCALVPAAAQTVPSSARATLFQPLSFASGVLAPGLLLQGWGQTAGRLPPPAAAGAFPKGPGAQCRAAIRAAERAQDIPDQLMAAIARVESGRREPDGTVDPWPWSINAEGIGHVYDSKAQAIAAVRALQSEGVRSIDVGCMQVNLMHHPDAFASLEAAFDPVANANFAAEFLQELHDETGTWPAATAWYHSATPALGADYRRKVMAALPEEQKRAEDPLPVTLPPPAPAVAGGGAGFAAGFHGGFATPLARGLPATTLRPVAGIGPNLAAPARLLPLPGAGAPRGLAAYRAAPIQVVTRPVVAVPLAPPGMAPAAPAAPRRDPVNPG